MAPSLSGRGMPGLNGSDKPLFLPGRPQNPLPYPAKFFINMTARARHERVMKSRSGRNFATVADVAVLRRG